jgi:hypothetical protein
MGKSSTTTQVAWNTKSADPTSWVVRINWNDHTRKLQEINEATFNLDSLVEFLCSAVFTGSKYTDINRNLLKQALQYSGNVTVLMDGFDEICPTHADKAAVILRELMKTKVERVWVTSRPVQRQKLETLLSVIAFSMKKLSNESQGKMLRDIWKEKANGENEKKFLNDYVESLLSQANKSVYQRNFTGCPLHIKMIATVFERNLETSLEKREISLPEKLDLLELYDKCIEKKLDIYEREKKKEDFTKASVQNDHEILTEISVEKLEKCSLLITLPSELYPQSDEEIQSTIQPFVKRVQAGKDNIGIVMNVVEDRPQFVHRTFAEYFTAQWFSKNFELKRNILERILFDSSCGIVKDVFDRILARGCPLHCAVLNRDTEDVETELSKNDVNALDSGGRTALHLIAAELRVDHFCEEITSSLLQYGASVHAEDNVLHFTPLGYAIKAENWLVVERLLKEPFNANDLELIRQRVDDESYIHRITDDIKGKNCSLLLQRLDDICANTTKAPLVKAAVERKQ